MTADTKAYVVGLLESYQKRSKQIDLLHYELSHPVRVSENEMIGALAGPWGGRRLSRRTRFRQDPVHCAQLSGSHRGSKPNRR